MIDYEEQTRSNNHISRIVINATRRMICYNLTIYDDMQLEVSEYAGLTLAINESSVRTLVNSTYGEIAVKIVDDDGKYIQLVIFNQNITTMYIGALI